MKLKTLKGQIKVITGLHIGTGSDIIEIGGMDNPVIKSPGSGEPYIPGSSIKGKMRSLMEWLEGKVIQNDGRPCSCGESHCKICRVFGCSAANKSSEAKALDRGPTRLIVRDAMLSEKSRQSLSKSISYFEEKHENNINRITAIASPRSMERVVPGTLFDFNLSYRILDMGDGGKLDESNFEDVVVKALALLEKDYLGGGGSRGNGQIRFLDLQDEAGQNYDLQQYQIQGKAS